MSQVSLVITFRCARARIADAVKKGAKVVLGGKRAAQGGSFFEPMVLTDVTYRESFWTDVANMAIL